MNIENTNNINTDNIDNLNNLNNLEDDVKIDSENTEIDIDNLFENLDDEDLEAYINQFDDNINNDNINNDNSNDDNLNDNNIEIILAQIKQLNQLQINLQNDLQINLQNNLKNNLKNQQNQENQYIEQIRQNNYLEQIAQTQLNLEKQILQTNEQQKKNEISIHNAYQKPLKNFIMELNNVQEDGKKIFYKPFIVHIALFFSLGAILFFFINMFISDLKVQRQLNQQELALIQQAKLKAQFAKCNSTKNTLNPNQLNNSNNLKSLKTFDDTEICVKIKPQKLYGYFGKNGEYAILENK